MGGGLLVAESAGEHGSAFMKEEPAP